MVRIDFADLARGAADAGIVHDPLPYLRYGDLRRYTFRAYGMRNRRQRRWMTLCASNLERRNPKRRRSGLGVVRRTQWGRAAGMPGSSAPRTSGKPSVWAPPRRPDALCLTWRKRLCRARDCPLAQAPRIRRLWDKLRVADPEKPPAYAKRDWRRPLRGLGAFYTLKSGKFIF